MSDIYYWRRYLVTENRKGNTHISDRLESKWLVRCQRIPKALGRWAVKLSCHLGPAVKIFFCGALCGKVLPLHVLVMSSIVVCYESR